MGVGEALEAGVDADLEEEHGHEDVPQRGQLPPDALGLGATGEGESGHEPHHRPLDVAGRVAVQRGLGDLLNQARIGGREIGLDLLEDSLLVF